MKNTTVKLIDVQIDMHVISLIKFQKENIWTTLSITISTFSFFEDKVRIEVRNLIVVQCWYCFFVHGRSQFYNRLKTLLQLLWIFSARFSSRHFHSRCWFKEVNFSLKNMTTFNLKLWLTLPTFFKSFFFASSSWACFLFTNRTIVFLDYLCQVCDILQCDFSLHQC